MKQFNIIAISTLTLLSLASCEMKDELTGDNSKKTDMGVLELGVSVRQPSARTRAEVSTAAFPVEIIGIGAEVSDIKKEFENVAKVPSSIPLPIGKYSVTSHTPGNMEKRMSAPYYSGSAQMTITKDITTAVSVVCKMQNSKIQMKYNADFLAAFQSWIITLDDGSNSVLTFDQTEITPDAIYWHFNENAVTTITVNIRAVTTSGITINEGRTYKKGDATENYENVSEFFGGGEVLDINMGTVVSSTGKVTGTTINTFITFEEENESVEIPVKESNNGGGEGGGENPDTEGPTLQLPQDVTYSLSDESSMPASADALITATAGLQSILVTITAGNDSFDEIMNDLRMDGQSFKTGGVDLVGNADFNSLLESVGLPEGPTVGQTEYTFPIGVFFTFLNITGPTDPGKGHQFNITVTDKNGDSATGTFKVTITE